MYNQIQYLPAYWNGYFDGIMAAQQQIWGYSLIDDLLTPDMIEETFSYINFDKPPD